MNEQMIGSIHASGLKQTMYLFSSKIPTKRKLSYFRRYATVQINLVDRNKATT